MANQATSRSDDLMVGAGVLLFHRSDDPHGLHHLGNVQEFNITTDVTTVEKNSAMNKDRELMASVVTAINPTGTLTMDEYNPYNLALGLYGREGVTTQAAASLSAVPYTVTSVPGIIELTDANGNRYRNIDPSTVTVGASTTTNATFQATTVTIDATIDTTVNANDTVKFNSGATNKDGTSSAGGGTIVANILNPVTTGYTIHVQVDTAQTTAGDLGGMELDIIDGANGQVSHVVVPAGQGTTFTWADSNTNTLTFTVGASDEIPTNDAFITFTYNAPVSGYTAGKDFILDEQMLRAGLIQIPSGSTIQEGSVVLITATVPGGDFVTVSGGDAGEIEGHLLFIGDPNIGGKYVLEGWKVKVTPDGDLTGLIGDDFGSFQLTVRFLADKINHPEAPYYKLTHQGRADGSSAKSGTYDPEY